MATARRHADGDQSGQLQMRGDGESPAGILPAAVWCLGLIVVIGSLPAAASDSIWLVVTGVGSALTATGGLQAVAATEGGLTAGRVVLVLLLSVTGFAGLAIILLGGGLPSIARVAAVLAVSIGWGLSFPVGLQRFFAATENDPAR